MLLVAAVCLRLGIWQRSRLQARRAANATAMAARARPVIDLSSSTDSSLADRRVVAHGTYDHSHEMLLRGQVLSGAPGVVVITPLRNVRGDSALLVVRGFLPSSDGITVPQLDSLDVPGVQAITGTARVIPPGTNRGQPLARDGRMTWREMELDAVRPELPYPLLGYLLFAAPAAGLPAWPRRLEPPSLDDGPHRSYMLQWFGFAAVALVMAVLALARHQASGWSEPTAASPSGAPPPPARSP